VDDLDPHAHEQAQSIPREFCATRPLWPLSFALGRPPHRVGRAADEESRSIELIANSRKPITCAFSGTKSCDHQTGWGRPPIALRRVMRRTGGQQLASVGLRRSSKATRPRHAVGPYDHVVRESHHCLPVVFTSAATNNRLNQCVKFVVEFARYACDFLITELC